MRPQGPSRCPSGAARAWRARPVRAEIPWAERRPTPGGFRPNPRGDPCGAAMRRGSRAAGTGPERVSEIVTILSMPSRAAVRRPGRADINEQTFELCDCEECDAGHNLKILPDLASPNFHPPSDFAHRSLGAKVEVAAAPAGRLGTRTSTVWSRDESKLWKPDSAGRFGGMFDQQSKSWRREHQGRDRHFGRDQAGG